MVDFVIEQGKTFNRVVRWQAPDFSYAAVTGITRAAPAVVTAVGHGVPNGWPVALMSVQGMVEINAPSSSSQPLKLRDREFVKAKVLTADTLELNSVNSSEFTPYVSGGYVVYRKPVDMAGFTARMQIKSRVGGTVLASTDIDDAPNNVISVVVDNALKTVTVMIPAADTAGFSWRNGVFDLEMVSGTGVVTAILSGKVTVTPEVTTST